MAYEINFCETKEQLKHLGEVVTGKVDGSPAGADINASTLAYTGQERETLPALLAKLGWYSVGEWSTDPLISNDNQYVLYNDIRYVPLSTPYQVDSAANPDPEVLVGTDLKVITDVTDEDITTAQNDIIGGSIFKGSNGETVEVGDEVEAGITHIRVNINGKPEIVSISPVTMGIVSALSDSGATIGGADVEFQPLSKLAPLKRVTDRAALAGVVIEGQEVRWLGYYEPSDGGSNWGVVYKGAHTEDGGAIFSIDNNTYIKANKPNSLLKYGVKTSSGALDLQEAANNRQQTERMLRNPELSSFIFNNQGTVNILGSVHPLRVDIEIDHRKGCHIAGYLKDPSLPDVLSGGHMFGFAQYKNPDDINDPDRLVITGPTTNVNYKLNGTVETVFRVEHTEPHNNNCLGFAWSENCSVTGKGGVTGSDHRGVNFDYDAENCVVDLGFIKNTSNEPVLMRGKTSQRSEFNKVKVRVVETLFDSGIPQNYRVVDIRNTNRAVVQVNSMKPNSAVKPNLTYVDNCGLASVEVGSVRDIAQCVRFVNSQSLVLNGVRIENAECLVARAGDNISEMKNIVISDMQCVGTLPTLYRDDRAPGLKTNGFELFSVHNCDFSEVNGSTAIWDSPVGAAGPKVYSLKDNATHAGWSSPQIFNELSYSEFITPAATSFSYDIEGSNNDYPYSKLQGRITQGSNAYQFEFDLTILARTGFNQIVSVFHESGSRMEVSTSKGAGQLVTFTLDNAGTGAVFSDIIVKN